MKIFLKKNNFFFFEKVKNFFFFENKKKILNRMFFSAIS